MLVIRRCLLGSSKGAEGDKLKYYDIPPIVSEDLPLISTDSLHAPPEVEPEIEPQPKQIHAEEPHPHVIHVEKPLSETVVEEPQESKVEEPQEPAEPEIQDLSALFGLREPDRSSLYTCTEILGSESCDNMVQGMSKAVTEWSWSRKCQRQHAIETEMLANRRFPPPIPRYIGRPCQFMKIKRGDGRITMSLLQMDRQPEQTSIEREAGQIRMQLMTYVRDAINKDVEASSSASTSEQVVETSDQETGSYREKTGTDKWDSSEKRELAVAA